MWPPLRIRARSTTIPYPLQRDSVAGLESKYGPLGLLLGGLGIFVRWNETLKAELFDRPR